MKRGIYDIPLNNLGLCISIHHFCVVELIAIVLFNRLFLSQRKYLRGSEIKKIKIKKSNISENVTQIVIVKNVGVKGSRLDSDEFRSSMGTDRELQNLSKM